MRGYVGSLLALVAFVATPERFAPLQGATAPFTFSPAAAGYFSFDTGALRGVLRADGASEGIVELIDGASGQSLTKEKYPGILSLYRVFSAGRRFPDARTAPHRAELAAGGRQVAVTWLASAEFPLEIRGVFSIPEARSVDLDLVCTPTTPLPSFELFISAYLRPAHRHFLFVQNTLHQRPAPAPVLLEPVATPFIDGCYLAFPRDDDACRRIFDGRWGRPPNPVHFALGRFYAVPLLGSRDPANGLSCCIFARPQDCFALECTYAREPLDSVADHNALYLSLGGTDVAAGESARFALRATVANLAAHADALAQHQAWLTRRRGTRTSRSGYRARSPARCPRP
jgi:hypothetical protein